jgi:hypothetical protein
MASKKSPLEELQSRKAELAIKCKAKGEEISQQTDYITDHFGEIAIKSIIGERFKRGKEKKTEIIELLVAEGIDAAVNIQKDPHDIKDKLIGALKRSATGVVHLLFK